MPHGTPIKGARTKANSGINSSIQGEIHFPQHTLCLCESVGCTIYIIYGRPIYEGDNLATLPICTYMYY